MTQVIQDPETGESKAKMTEEQTVLAREIRRRGKNEKAAEDCRRMANERMTQLESGVENGGGYLQMSRKREGRAERIARERGLNIFISVNDIINIQYDEFTERLEQYKGGVLLSSLLGPPDPTKTQVIQDPETGESKAKMTEEQHILAREIRRRGKNEKAAQDCRKRANERISQLKNDVERERLMKEQKRQESAQLAQQLRHLEEKNRQQDNTIMRHFNLPPEGYMELDQLPQQLRHLNI